MATAVVELAERVALSTAEHSCYHDVMVTKKTTTIRLSEELATTVEVVARGRGVSVNALVIDALTAEIDRVRHDDAFMASLREIAERDREILDRLAQ
jgi:predicted DNA-binding ribbon-helix-helix protein